MKSLRVWIYGIVCLIVAGLATSDAAQKPEAITGKTNRILIYPGPDDSIAQLKKQGASKVDDYGSYWLAEVPDTQLKSLQKSHGSRVQDVSYYNRIDLSEVTIDTTQAQAPVAENLKESIVRGKVLRIVQFKGPAIPEWMSKLQAVKNLQVINYIPNNAYLVSVSASSLTDLQGLQDEGIVQWIGVYQPEYKLPQALRSASGEISIRVGVLNNSDASGTVSTLRRYALSGVESHITAVGQILCSFRINSRDLSAIAQLPSVLWVQPALVIQKQDEVQALVVASKTNGFNGLPLAGESYLSFLAGGSGSGATFSENPEDYPLLDICDTGVDRSPPYGLPLCNSDSFKTFHPSFNQYFDLNGLTSAAISNLPCCILPYGDRKLYIGTGDDTDGHGTRVASIAVGFDVLPDEVIHCYFETYPSIIDSGTCFYCAGAQPRSGGVGANPGECNVPVGAIVTEVGQGIPCTVGGTNGVLVKTDWTFETITCAANLDADIPPPPWYISRRDFDGFQLGLGVSPFGPFGVSSMEVAQLNPEGVVQGSYLIGRARISNNSWGQILDVGVNDGAYDALCQSYDSLTRDAVTTGSSNTIGQTPRNQQLLFVFSAGNNNGQLNLGGFGDILTTPPANAKNVITVGASNLRAGGSTFDLSVFSSFGPTRDGRFKPDMVAPGAGVAGAISQASYDQRECGGCNFNSPSAQPCQLFYRAYPVISRLYNSEESAFPRFNIWGAINFETDGVTSYAAPAVSGGAQLLYWYFLNQLAQLPPTPAMMKAYLLNSARYLPITDPFTGAMDRLPSIGQGMGMLDLARMFDGVPRILRDESTLRAIDLPLYSTNAVSQQSYFTGSGQSYELTGQIVDSTKPFRVTLTWTDAPGNPAVTKQLVNDLDLEVTVNGHTYFGNDFETQYAAGTINPVHDTANNVESVYLPPGTTGNWSIVVRAANIAGDGVTHVGSSNDQDFALVVYNANGASDIPNATTNNACQTATEIRDFPFTFTNNLTSADYANVHPSPTATRGGIDEFFRIPHPSPGTTITIDTFGSGFDTVLSVWSGGCGSLVEQVSNNDASNTFQSAVSFTANGLDDYYVVVEPHNNGAGGKMVLNMKASVSPVVVLPSPLNFPDQIAGATSAVLTVTEFNGLTVPLQIQSVTITGSNASEFLIFAETCSGSVIGTNKSCGVGIVFVPTNAGPHSAQLVIQDNATGSPRIVPLFGNGLPAAPLVCLSSSHLTFGTQSIGVESPTQSVTVVNCGTAPLTISDATVGGPSASQFSVASVSCGPLPASLIPGASCTFGVTFTPTDNGSQNAFISFGDNAADTPQTVFLTGSGCTAISLAPNTLVNPLAGAAYSQLITASGGVGPYSFAVTSGGLPPGLALSTSGLLSGTATNLGSFTITVTASDVNGCTGAKQYTLITGCSPFVLTPSTLPQGSLNAPYAAKISVSGASGIAAFSVSGALPAGLTLSNTGLLSGVPTVLGTFNFTINVVDQNACTTSIPYTMTINCAPISLSPPVLPSTIIGGNYSQKIQALGATDPVSFLVTSGSLPPGINLSSAGTLSGSATTIGTFGFTITANDVNGCVGSNAYTLAVNCTAFSITPQTLPDPAIGTPYSQTLTVVGHTGTVTFVQTEGIIPPGLTLSPAGVLSGTPTLFGTFTFKVHGVDTVNGCTGERFFTLKVGCPTLTLSPSPTSGGLPYGNVNVFYSQTLVASGGIAPYTFTQTAGSLPAGMSLSTNGVLSGTPTSGSSIFTVTVKDSSGCQSSGFNYLFILSNNCPPIAVSPSSIPDSVVNQTYNQTVSASGGTGPYRYQVHLGALPPGLALSSSGVISGKPLGTGSTTFTVAALDGMGCPGFKTYTINVACDNVAFTPANLATGIVGVSYSESYTATSGLPAVSFSVTGGALPNGLSMDSTGLVSGIPTTPGTFAYTVRATDAANCSISQVSSLTILPASDLKISQSVTPDPAIVTSNLTYTMIVTNIGPSTATSVTLTDALPAEVTFVSASSGCGSIGNLVICDLGTLAKGDSTTVTIEATANVQSTITNVATVSGANYDPALGNNTSTVISTASNMVEFAAILQVVNVNAHAAEVTVTRRGQLNTAASVHYSTSDGSAVGGADYTPTSGTLNFGVGESSHSFTVAILNTVIAKGASKSVKLALQNVSGAMLGARSSSTLNIVGSPSKSPVVFTSPNGDVVTVKLSGAGAMAVSLVGTSGQSIDEIKLTDTDATSGLSISVKRSRQSDGLIEVGRIVGDGGLKSLSASAVTLVGEGLNLGADLGSLTLNGVRNSAVMVNGNIGTVSINVVSNSLIAANYLPGNLSDPFAGGTFVPGTTIKTVKIKQLIASTIAASQVGKVQLSAVTTANSGEHFGVLAGASIGSVKVSAPSWTWNSAGSADQSVGDFHVKF